MREQLLAATIDLLTTQGWRAATTKRIAECAGVNEVTLFRYFGSKDVLLREAMAWHAARSPIAQLPADPSDPPAELVTWAQQQYAHLLEVRRHVRRTIGEFDAAPDVASWSRQIPRRMHQNLQDYITRLRDMGRTRGAWHPCAAASFLLGALFADAINRDFMPVQQLLPTDDVPRLYVELFLSAIGYVE